LLSSSRINSFVHAVPPFLFSGKHSRSVCSRGRGSARSTSCFNFAHSRSVRLCRWCLPVKSDRSLRAGLPSRSRLCPLRVSHCGLHQSASVFHLVLPLFGPVWYRQSGVKVCVTRGFLHSKQQELKFFASHTHFLHSRSSAGARALGDLRWFCACASRLLGRGCVLCQ
jgi:hypothetical protein